MNSIDLVHRIIWRGFYIIFVSNEAVFFTSSSSFMKKRSHVLHNLPFLSMPFWYTPAKSCFTCLKCNYDRKADQNPKKSHRSLLEKNISCKRETLWEKFLTSFSSFSRWRMSPFILTLCWFPGYLNNTAILTGKIINKPLRTCVRKQQNLEHGKII